MQDILIAESARVTAGEYAGKTGRVIAVKETNAGIEYQVRVVIPNETPGEPATIDEGWYLRNEIEKA